MKKTFEELNKMKFDVVEHFGMTKKGIFFIMNTVAPAEYGADCQSYEWYEADVKTEDDVDALKGFIKNLFGMNIIASSVKEAVKAVNALDEYFRKTVPAVDWGACHVKEIPISEVFKKKDQDDPDIMDIRSVEGLVLDAMTDYPGTRNSDNYLFYVVCKTVLLSRGIDVDDLGFKNVMLNVRELGLPQYETVGRARRKIQQHHPEMKCDPSVAENRTMNQDAFMEYAVEGGDL